MSETVLLKICSACGRVKKYRPGDRLPHWGHPTEAQWRAIIAAGYREHHTVCPECRQKGRRDVRP